MLSDVQFDNLIETIYEAALNPVDWRRVVDQLTIGFGAIGASVYTPFSYRAGVEPIWSTDADPEFVAVYASRYAKDDILGNALWKHVPVKSLVYSWDDIILRRDLEAWPGYEELLKPRGVVQGVGLLVEAEDHRAGQLMIYCPKWKDGEVIAAKRIFDRVARHLSRAMRVHWHLTTSRQTANAARMTLDMFQSGVVWLSATGEVLYTNATMNKLIERRDGIHVSAGKLTFHHRGNLTDLAKSIGRAVEGHETSFAIERLSENVPLRMTVFPLPMQASALRISQAVAIGFVSEAATPMQSCLEAARSIYKLTPAETRVLGLLMSGGDAREVAANIGSSEHTVRTQIKSLLAKCGVNRQADLIRIVATLPQVRLP